MDVKGVPNVKGLKTILWIVQNRAVAAGVTTNNDPHRKSTPGHFST